MKPRPAKHRLAPLAVLATLPLLASCAAAVPSAPSAPSAPVVPAAVAPVAAASAPVAEASPSPSASDPTTPTPAVTPAPAADEVNTTLGVRRWQDPATPAPLPTLTAEQQAAFGSCLDTRVTIGSKGACVLLAQTTLHDLGFLTGKAGKAQGVAAMNAVHRYQRSRDLKPTAVIDQTTWYALASGQAARSTELPAECKLPGVVLCVDQGTQQLRYVKDGEVLRTVKVRTGGWAKHAKTDVWRLFPTANGLFRVYNKHVNPPSENYGEGAMPYSVMFDPNMYVHYSSGFARQGYAQSSHGCVNVASRTDVQWLFKNTPINARVYVW